MILMIVGEPRADRTTHSVASYAVYPLLPTGLQRPKPECRVESTTFIFACITPSPRVGGHHAVGPRGSERSRNVSAAINKISSSPRSIKERAQGKKELEAWLRGSLREGVREPVTLGRTKATMFPIINKIRKLRSYRQGPPGIVHKSLIKKDITFRIGAAQVGMLLKRRYEHASIKDSRPLRRAFLVN
jgi:hypothetical protein